MFNKECKWSSDCCKAFKVSFLGALAAILLVMLVCALFGRMHGIKWMGKKMDCRMDYDKMQMHKEMPKMNPDMMLEKLEMSQEELDSALESGKTISELMEEKGVELRMCSKGKECQ